MRKLCFLELLRFEWSEAFDYSGHMKPIGVAELKARLSRYLNQVKAGREVIISERGVPIAKLVRVEGDLDARRQRLAKTGLLRLGAGNLRRLLRSPRAGDPQEGEGVLASLLEEREEGR